MALLGLTELHTSPCLPMRKRRKSSSSRSYHPYGFLLNTDLSHQFTTFGSGDEMAVHGTVSDKAHAIAIKLTRDAVTEYARFAYSLPSRTTLGSGYLHRSHINPTKTAMVTISSIRIQFGRIHTRNGTTKENHIYLECGSFRVLGCIGENIWGKPLDIEKVDDIALWVAGLRKGGGGGYVSHVVFITLPFSYKRIEMCSGNDAFHLNPRLTKYPIQMHRSWHLQIQRMLLWSRSLSMLRGLSIWTSLSRFALFTSEGWSLTAILSSLCLDRHSSLS